jgi:hypothetical protein
MPFKASPQCCPPNTKIQSQIFSFFPLLHIPTFPFPPLYLSNFPQIYLTTSLPLPEGRSGTPGNIQTSKLFSLRPLIIIIIIIIII